MEKKLIIGSKLYDFDEHRLSPHKWSDHLIFQLLRGFFSRLQMMAYFFIMLCYLLLFVDSDRYGVSRKAIHDVIHELSNQEAL